MTIQTLTVPVTGAQIPVLDFALARAASTYESSEHQGTRDMARIYHTMRDRIKVEPHLITPRYKIEPRFIGGEVGCLTFALTAAKQAFASEDDGDFGPMSQLLAVLLHRVAQAPVGEL